MRRAHPRPSPAGCMTANAPAPNRSWTYLPHSDPALAAGADKTAKPSSPRPPTAFQISLDRQGIRRSKSCRALGTWPLPSPPLPSKITDRIKLTAGLG